MTQGPRLFPKMSRHLKNGPTSIEVIASGVPRKEQTTPSQTDEESFRIQHAKLTGLEPASQRSDMKGQSSEPRAVGTSGVDNLGANSVSKLHGRFQIFHQFGQISRAPSDFIRKKFYWCPRSSNKAPPLTGGAFFCLCMPQGDTSWVPTSLPF